MSHTEYETRLRRALAWIDRNAPVGALLLSHASRDFAIRDGMLAAPTGDGGTVSLAVTGDTSPRAVIELTGSGEHVTWERHLPAAVLWRSAA